MRDANDVAGALVKAGSRSAGRRRGGAAAGQPGRVLRAGPVRDQEARSTVSRLTMGSPAVQIPRAARWSSWSLEETRWSSAGAAVAGQSRRHKSCELACRSRRERAAWPARKAGYPCTPKPPQLCWGPDFHTFRVRDCQRYCVSRLLWVHCGKSCVFKVAQSQIPFSRDSASTHD